MCSVVEAAVQFSVSCTVADLKVDCSYYSSILDYIAYSTLLLPVACEWALASGMPEEVLSRNPRKMGGKLNQRRGTSSWGLCSSSLLLPRSLGGTVGLIT